MKKTEKVYIELVPEEGYVLTNGEIFTDYVCVLSTETEEIEKWVEVKEQPKEKE